MLANILHSSMRVHCLVEVISKALERLTEGGVCRSISRFVQVRAFLFAASGPLLFHLPGLLMSLPDSPGLPRYLIDTQL